MILYGLVALYLKSCNDAIFFLPSFLQKPFVSNLLFTQSDFSVERQKH